MTGILVVAEIRNGEVRELTGELIGAAVQLKEQGAGEVRVLLIDPSAPALATELAREGVDEIITVADAPAQFEAHVAQSVLAQAIRDLEPAVVLAGHSVDSFSFAPAVAASERLGLATDVIALQFAGVLTAFRPAFGGKVIERLEFPGRETVVVLVRPGVFNAPEKAEAPVRSMATPENAGPRSEHLGFIPPEVGEVDITTAPLLVSIGRGVTENEDVERISRLAQRMGGTMSGSRPLVDAGLLPSARQVGQSGRTVKPRVYLALGISGAVQHLAGIRAAETVIAVNTDPEAPIFGRATYGAVADLNEVVDVLEEQFA